jgi:N-acyl-D-amino-acid deacylase
MLPSRRHALLILALLCAAPHPLLAQTAFDLVITNGHIIDGTGSPWYSGDLGIRDGKVAASAPSMPQAK